MSDPIIAIDLFCGAGGLSTGLALACENLNRDVELAAINHWTKAIETHQENHPWATRHNAKVDALHPPEVVPADTTSVDILVGGPECIHFSKARGGKPVNEQKRVSPWHIISWLEKLNVQNFLIENVPELQKWGPVTDDGEPTKNGKVFEAWIDSLHALGYSVDWTVLNAADYGDATSRRRLFVVGRKDKRATFPEPTHADPSELAADADDDRAPHRTAAEIIDWSDPGDSLWTRDIDAPRIKPLKGTTMSRVAEGIRRHGADVLTPFADAVASLGRDRVRTLRDDIVPLADAPEAAATRDTPFFVEGPICTSESPTDSGPAPDLCPPYILGQQSGSVARDVTERPVPTISTSGAVQLCHPETILLPDDAPSDDATPTHVARINEALDNHVIEPYLVPFYGERKGQAPRTHEITEPLPTVTASGSSPAVTLPYLLRYPDSVQPDAELTGQPAPTTTTRVALVLPEYYPLALDIRFRMLQPRELAAAMGFPDDYTILGNKTETKKQIGNAVPVNLATALCEQILTDTEPSLQTFHSQEAPADD